MLYSLSASVIADTIHALAAMELLRSDPESDLSALLSPLIDPERRPQLMLMVRNAFAELMIDLLPFVDNASLDAEDAVCNAAGQSSADVSDPLMQVDLRTPSGLTSSFHGLLRRKLELSVVYGVLSACVPSLASAESSSASLFATSVVDMARSSRQALLDMLARVPAPFLRRGW